MKRSVTITIDGPAGTGKSTVSRMLAKRLGLEFLDTGAMYRGAGAIGLLNGIDLRDGAAVAKAIEESGMHFDWSADPPRLLIEKPVLMDLTGRLRDADVTAAAAIVAQLPELRRVMVEGQRRIRERHPRLVTEGRDQGSVVFPDAEVKFYLDASVEVRAARRADQLQRSGQEADGPAVRQEILSRDHADRTRSEGPLVVPEGAIRVDTTDLDFGQVVDVLEKGAKERLAAMGRLAGE